MGWTGDPGSWRKPGAARVVRDPPGPPQPTPEPSRPLSTFERWAHAVLDELEKPELGLFGRRAVTALVAVALLFVAVEQQSVSFTSVSVMVGGFLGGFLYTVWPLVTGDWWRQRD